VDAPPEHTYRRPDLDELLLQSPKVALGEALVAMTGVAPFTEDPNPEVNSFLEQLSAGKARLENNRVGSLVEFPFLICVVGAPCSGKNTICQFIATYFDVCVVNVGEKAVQCSGERSVFVSSNDDKMIIPAK
jgi:hypothetical protein